MARPVTGLDRQRVRELHAEGKTRNDIARAIDRSASTVTKLAGEMGLSFDRAATEAATAAKVADAKARRAAIVARMYDQIEKILTRLEREQHTITETSYGKKISWVDTDLPPDQIRALMQAIGAATQTAVRIEQLDSGDSGAVGSLLGSLFGALQAKHGTGDDA